MHNGNLYLVLKNEAISFIPRMLLMSRTFVVIHDSCRNADRMKRSLGNEAKLRCTAAMEYLARMKDGIDRAKCTELDGSKDSFTVAYSMRTATGKLGILVRVKVNDLYEFV